MMAYDADRKRLTLGGISPVTLYFTDRPERIAGTMQTGRFPSFWTEGRDSFLSDPPNADLSILEGGELRQVVVVLRDPELSGDDLTTRSRCLKETCRQPARPSPCSSTSSACR